MASWKKVIVSGSDAHLNHITMSGNLDISGTISKISGSSTSTGSFGRVEATTLGGTLTTAAQTNITSVGTIGTGTWEGTTVAVDQGGTGATSLTDLITLTTHTTGNYVKKIVSSTGLSGGVDSEGATATLSVDASQTQITSLGTIGTGTWEGTEVGLGYGGTELVGETDGKIVVADGSGAPVHLDIGSSSGITILGTIATGVWNGTAVASAYLDADTAHLTTNQTFTGNKTFSAPITGSHYSGSATSTGSFGRIEVLANTLAIGGTEIGKTVADNITALDQQLSTTSSPTFANLTATGDITAQNYIVSSSVTYMTQSFSSGSTIFGDTSSDTHIFTGSLQITGGLQVDNGNISGSASSTGSFGSLNLAGSMMKLHVGQDGLPGTMHVANDFRVGSWVGNGNAWQFKQNTSNANLDISYIYANGSIEHTPLILPYNAQKPLQVALDIDLSGGSYNITGSAASSASFGKIIANQYGGNISGSSTSTGSFGRVEATTLGGTLTTAAQTNITSVGTIGTGVWNGTAVASAYLDADTAHLTTTQTFSGDKTFSATLNTAAITATGNISGSATSTGSFGIVESDSGIFYTSGSSLRFESPNLTTVEIAQTGLGTNSAAPSLRLYNNDQGNNYDVTLSVGSSQLNVNGHIYLASHTFKGAGFDGVNSRGGAGTALFSATGNGGDGGGMYFGGGGAYDVRFSTTGKERLRIDTAGNGGGIQTSGSLSVGGLTAGAVAHIFATGNISGSASSTGSFGSLVVSDKVQGNLTIGGNLIIEGDTVQQQVANLNVEDRFILLNSGSASGDGGLVVQTESHTAGVVYGYDDSESRWGFQQGTKLSATGSVLAPDAYASAVVTSDDANYQKNGNIRVESGEIYIYVE